MVTPMAWTDELERAACSGKPIPDGLGFPEKCLYIAMRGLYVQYRSGVISLNQAKKEKRLLINDFGQMELHEKSLDRSIKAWKWVDLNLNKCSCPECLALKKTILELENVM